MHDRNVLAAARARPDRRPRTDSPSPARFRPSSELSGATYAASRCLSSKNGVPIDPGPAADLGRPADAAYKQAAVDVIRKSRRRSIPPTGRRSTSGSTRSGNNPLGHERRPRLHGQPGDRVSPMRPSVVLQADFARVLAEFWADGPKSETPPGHWNVDRERRVDDSPPKRRGSAAGRSVDRLQWDVKLYFALNGAVHDAAIAAWGLKRQLRSRSADLDDPLHGASSGQSSDPNAPSYDPDGLPLVPGLIELITKESSAPGQRHAALAGHVGEIAIRAWRGNPQDPKTQVERRRLDPRRRWVPYQRPTFVTPAFPGFISGHSTFSRAAAEVLAALTGSPVLPRRRSASDASRPATSSSSTGPSTTSRSSGRPTTTPRTRPASRGSTAGSTSPPTTSPAAGSDRRSASRRMRSPSATSPARRVRGASGPSAPGACARSCRASQRARG